MADLNGTLSGGTMGPNVGASPIDPEEQKIREAFQRLGTMLDQGQLTLSPQVQQLFAQEQQATQAEPATPALPVPQAPGALQSFGAQALGNIGSELTGNQNMAQNVANVLNQRRQEQASVEQANAQNAQGSAAEKVSQLRQVRRAELQQEIEDATKANDNKLALKKAEELAVIDAREKKSAEANKNVEAEKERQAKLDQIRATFQGRMSLAQRTAELKQIVSDFGVPKEVAAMMQQRRQGIINTNQAFVQSLGGLAMIDTDKLTSIQSKMQSDLDSSDQSVLADWKNGKLPGIPVTPGAGHTETTIKTKESASTPADTTSERQAKIDRIRAAAKS